MSPFALMQEIMDIVLVVANSAISLDFTDCFSFFSDTHLCGHGRWHHL